MTAEETLNLIMKLKEAGFDSIEVGPDGNVRVMSTSPKAQAPKQSSYVPDLKAEEIMKPMSVLDDYSEEEIKYYATPYFDELQAQKQLRAQQLKDGIDG